MSPVVIFVVVRTLLMCHTSIVTLIVHEAAVWVRLGGVVPGGAGSAIWERVVALPGSLVIDTRTTLPTKHLLFCLCLCVDFVLEILED